MVTAIYIFIYLKLIIEPFKYPLFRINLFFFCWEYYVPFLPTFSCFLSNFPTFLRNVGIKKNNSTIWISFQVLCELSLSLGPWDNQKAILKYISIAMFLQLLGLEGMTSHTLKPVVDLRMRWEMKKKAWENFSLFPFSRKITFLAPRFILPV